jgi:hypothetical protein
VSASRAAAQRPRKRGRRPKTHAAVLQATTELLQTTPLAELSVAQILSAAPSDALGATLAWGAERAFHIAMTGHHRTLVNENALVEPLLQLYIGTIYGQPVPVG